MKSKRGSFECPQCGSQVRVGRLACPECGSDANTGWQDANELDYRSVEIPDGYGPEDDAPPRAAGRVWLVRVLILLTVAAVLFLAVAR